MGQTNVYEIHLIQTWLGSVQVFKKFHDSDAAKAHPKKQRLDCFFHSLGSLTTMRLIPSSLLYMKNKDFTKIDMCINEAIISILNAFSVVLNEYPIPS